MKKTISQKRLRDFGLLIGFGFPLIIGLLLPALSGHSFRIWTLWFGLPGLILGITAPSLLLYPYKAWMAIGHSLGWLNSKLILGVVFLFVLQPIALVMRIAGYDPLKIKKNHKATYKEDKTHHKINLNRIF